MLLSAPIDAEPFRFRRVVTARESIVGAEARTTFPVPVVVARVGVPSFPIPDRTEFDVTGRENKPPRVVVEGLGRSLPAIVRKAGMPPEEAKKVPEIWVGNIGKTPKVTTVPSVVAPEIPPNTPPLLYCSCEVAPPGTELKAVDMVALGVLVDPVALPQMYPLGNEPEHCAQASVGVRATINARSSFFMRVEPNCQL